MIITLSFRFLTEFSGQINFLLTQKKLSQKHVERNLFEKIYDIIFYATTLLFKSLIITVVIQNEQYIKSLLNDIESRIVEIFLKVSNSNDKIILEIVTEKIIFFVSRYSTFVFKIYECKLIIRDLYFIFVVNFLKNKFFK